MNTLDIVLVLLFVPGIVRGLSKGILEQIISLVGIIAGVWAAFKFSSLLCGWLGQHLAVSQTLLNVIAFVLVLVAVIIIMILVAKLFTKIAKMGGLGWVNRLLGMVFALAVSALILSLLVILFDTLNARFGIVKSPVLEESLLYPLLRDLGYLVFPYFRGLLSLQS